MPRYPRKLRMSFGKICQGLLKLLQGFCSVQVHFIDGLSWKMEMRILKPGYNQAAVQIDNCGVRCGERTYFLIRADGQDFVSANGHGLRLWPRVGFSSYFPIYEDPIGVLLRRLRQSRDRHQA